MSKPLFRLFQGALIVLLLTVIVLDIWLFFFAPCSTVKHFSFLYTPSRCIQ
jgi:hypothetical protein